MSSSVDRSPRLQRAVPPDQCRVYEQIAMACVHRTLAQYSAHIRPKVAHRRVDLTKWQPVKTRDNLHVYKPRREQTGRPRATSTVSSGRGSVVHTPSISLLCVGSVAGSLEDAMYATVAPTALALTTRSLLFEDERAQHRVLQVVKATTTDDPFTHMALKWTLRPAKVASLIKPRELVCMDASGFIDISRRRRGVERVGYSVSHSVYIPDLEPATTRGAVRAWHSVCTLYRQKAHGIVDVYVTLESDAGGSLPLSLEIATATDSLLAIASVMECALSKKLTWLLRRKDASISRSTTTEPKSLMSSCRACSQRISSFSSVEFCRVCCSSVCSRCVTTHKLVLPATTQMGAISTSMQVCACCSNQARRRVSAVQIAKEAITSNNCQLELFVLEKPSSQPISEKLSGTDSFSLSESLLDLDGTDYESDDLDEFDEELVRPLPTTDFGPLRLFRQLMELNRRAEQTHAMMAQQSQSFQLHSKLRTRAARSNSSPMI